MTTSDDALNKIFLKIAQYEETKINLIQLTLLRKDLSKQVFSQLIGSCPGEVLEVMKSFKHLRSKDKLFLDNLQLDSVMADFSRLFSIARFICQSKPLP